MDLSPYSLEDIFLSAIKAEVDSREAYSIMAGIARNAFLKDRLRFLADEEEKHRKMLEAEFRRQLPDAELKLPEFSPVPLPEIDVSDESTPMSQLLRQAMDAELAARDFYMEFARFVADRQELVLTLGYFARMEAGHYELLKTELEAELEFEDYDEYNPLMHVGP